MCEGHHGDVRVREQCGYARADQADERCHREFYSVILIGLRCIHDKRTVEGTLFMPFKQSFIVSILLLLIYTIQK